jgi:hypothetical protein
MSDCTYAGGSLVTYTTRCDCHGRPTCWWTKCGWCGVVLSRHAVSRSDALAAGREALDGGHVKPSSPQKVVTRLDGGHRCDVGRVA